MRHEYLPYSAPSIGEEEIAEVADSLRSGWLSTGPKVKKFEAAFAEYTGARHAIAVNSWTGGYHMVLRALGVGPGDEVIVPTLTFCSTANMVVHLGAKPVLVDVDSNFLVTAAAIERAITPRTKAIVPVHYGGQSCDLDPILALAARHHLPVVEDAAHGAGSAYRGRMIGVHGKATIFSFYATKNMTTGEGGMITTGDSALERRLRTLALHGMSRDAWARYSAAGSWCYEVSEPGYKYNMTDIQAAIGIHQLRKLNSFIGRRHAIARRYDEAFADLPEIRTPRRLPHRTHTYHLYPICLDASRLSIDRAGFIEQLSRRGIGASVHFIPLHRHPFYASAYGYDPARFPVAERLFAGLLSLPGYPRMTARDVEDVIAAVRDIVIGSRIKTRVAAAS
ncbi:MAG TPA: DegT/DnrJ/EryC1/StrS family aminotransferase [Bryobacteraceae bacterium]|jgi:dTDP-4-amino-4,6-dideoxygalactose transaminase|nr:DegT/DnrJ/EryC1/StrS family aminotransferase [Bryobacteraceae bacterium]